MRGLLVGLAVLGAALPPVAASNKFNYIPVPLESYPDRHTVPVDVNSLHSHDAILSYDFYSLKFCRPPQQQIDDYVNGNTERLGQIIWGERIEPSLYSLTMNVDKKCVVLKCPGTNSRLLKKDDLQRFETRINNGYRGNFVIDNLPVVAKSLAVTEKTCVDPSPRGWALGRPKRCNADGKTHINNHVAFEISINRHEDKWIIVGVNVEPFSIDHVDEDHCGPSFKIEEQHQPVTTDLEGGKTTKEIIWTYSVKFTERKDIGWSNRWDAYLSLAYSNSNSRVHWVSIINSLLIILCLSAVVAMILLRTLHIDFNRYNNPESLDEQQEEMGWKLVHGDVFRNPAWPGAFSVLIGTGVQLMGMLALSLVFAILGFLSPANRGGLITSAMLLFVLMAVCNGMVTGVMLNMFGEKRWKTVFAAGLAYPGLLFVLWLLMEFYIFNSRKGANTAPILSVLNIMGLWFGVSVPLVVLGAGFGFKWPAIKPVTETFHLPRKIPPQRWYLELPILMILPGMIPFGAAFIELRFILYSMWRGMVYYVFGFLAISCGTVIITAAEVTVVIVYFLLVFEDHRWWWRSFFIPAGMGLHFFMYSIYYYKTQLHLRTWLAFFIYFETMAMVSLSLWIAVGTIGFVSSFIFVRAIYSRIKID